MVSIIIIPIIWFALETACGIIPTWKRKKLRHRMTYGSNKLRRQVVKVTKGETEKH